MQLLNLLDINTVFFTILGYPVSVLEFTGTVLYFASVYLISRKMILTWPVGIVSVILYAVLFYQVQLYSDMLEQSYYLVISVIGWITWKKTKRNEKTIPSFWSTPKLIAGWAGLTALATLILAFAVSRFHIWMPTLFPEPADFPRLDALTTIMSLVAMYLITVRRNEGWIYWIIVDVIGIGLYWHKNVRFIALQYVFLLIMAAYGLYYWAKKKEQPS